MLSTKQKIKNQIIHHLSVIYPNSASTKELEDYIVSIIPFLGVNLSKAQALSFADGAISGLSRQDRIKCLFSLHNSSLPHKPASIGIQKVWGLSEKEYFHNN